MVLLDLLAYLAKRVVMDQLVLLVLLVLLVV